MGRRCKEHAESVRGTVRVRYTLVRNFKGLYKPCGSLEVLDRKRGIVGVNFKLRISSKKVAKSLTAETCGILEAAWI